MTGNGLYHLFMVIWGMVYYCFNHIIIIFIIIIYICIYISHRIHVCYIW